MSWKPVPLPDGSYMDASRPFSDQDLVNYWVENAEGPGTRSNFKLVQLPGLRSYLEFGDGPVRGMRNVEGKLFIVSDTHAYWLKAADELVQLGEIPGRSSVWICHNQDGTGQAYQVMFSTGPDAWIWNIVDETWEKVTDDAFRGGRSLIYLNSRFLGIEQQRRYFANSDEGDGMAWDSVETYQAESSPDRLVALIDFAGEVYTFNERTLEIFVPSSSPSDIENHIYYVRQGPPVEIGAASAHSVARLDNRVFVVSSKGAGYYMSGYTPVRITTHAIEKAWQDCDLSKVFCFTYESRGHAVWYVTFPDGHTWGYDCATQKWHRRETIGLNRWRVNALVQWKPPGEDPIWLAGSYNSGVLYRLDWDFYLDGCDELVRSFTTGVLHDEGNRVTVNGLRIECDTGYGLSSCVEPDTVDPVEPPIITGTLADGAVGVAYSDTLLVSLGVPPYSNLQIISGSLPPGLSESLASDLITVSGTPT